MVVIIVTILLFVIYLLLLIYYRQSWLQIPVTSGQSVTGKEQILISVIIPARNEQENITSCLESVTSQTYPAHLFEVIVVDDHSTDDTASVVRSFTDKNVTLISLRDVTENEKLNSYKKKAIEVAIAKASGRLIVTTDADCIVPSTWLASIAACYQASRPAFIAAPVAYYGENNFLQRFQSLDFMTLQGITGAAVYKKFHNMCNGANLAYEKTAFYEVGGFTGIDTIASGDDMLLMHKIAGRYPGRIMYLKSGDAIVETKPAATWREFFSQRIRWASKADKYPDTKITAVLILVYLLNAWILFLGIFSIFHPFYIVWLTGLLTGKTIAELFFLYPVAVFFNKQKLLWWFPAAQPFHILYTIIAGWLGKFGSYRWKERKVK